MKPTPRTKKSEKRLARYTNTRSGNNPKWSTYRKHGNVETNNTDTYTGNTSRDRLVVVLANSVEPIDSLKNTAASKYSFDPLYTPGRRTRRATSLVAIRAPRNNHIAADARVAASSTRRCTSWAKRGTNTGRKIGVPRKNMAVANIASSRKATDEEMKEAVSYIRAVAIVRPPPARKTRDISSSRSPNTKSCYNSWTSINSTTAIAIVDYVLAKIDTLRSERWDKVQSS